MNNNSENILPNDSSINETDINMEDTINSINTINTLDSNNNIYSESEQVNQIIKPSNIRILEKPFYKMNILEILIEMKNTWFQILDELLAGDFSIGVLTKNNRMFYVGLTILIFAIILFIYDYAIDSSDPLKNLINSNGGVVEIRHIYESK
jgi:hypothetical protein